MNNPTERKSKTVVISDAVSPEASPTAKPYSRRRRKRRALATFGFAAAGVAALAIAVVGVAAWTARNPKPAGQVMAVVDGIEVTEQDLRAEARARGVALTADNRQLLFVAVIDRTLLAKEARTRKLDREASFPADRRRIEQDLLASQLAAQETRAMQPVSDAEVRRYIESHPYAYADRQDLSLHQVSFQADDGLMQRIGETPTMTALLAALDRLSVPHVETMPVISTADMAPELNEALLNSPEDGAVITRQGQRVIASALLAADPTPLSEQEALPKARLRLQQELAAAQMEGLLRRLHGDAPITYRDAAASK